MGSLPTRRSVELNNSSTPDIDAAAHHDTHALPPQFVQEVYWHYREVKLSILESDLDIIDFHRGLTSEQQQLLPSVGIIPGSTIQSACSSFRQAVSGTPVGDQSPQPPLSDVTVYEHRNFPGLQIAPGILPAETQVLFVSEIMHRHLADPRHKINLEADYEIEYPDKELSGDFQSLFTYLPTEDHLKPKDPSKNKPINMAQTLSRKLRWLTIGEQYHWPTRSYLRDGPTTFPSELETLVTGLFPHIKPESGVCLLYGTKDYMPVHRDVSEQCQTGLASFSFGCDGILVIARGEAEAGDAEEKKRRTVAIRVRSGDCVHMNGETRWAWHAMARTIPNTCPPWLASWPVIDGMSESEKMFSRWRGYMGSKRLNVSCRQVWI